MSDPSAATSASEHDGVHGELHAQHGRDAHIERTAVRAASKILVITLVLVVLALLLWRLRALVLIVAIAVFIAALLNPLVRFVMRLNIPRSAATIVVYFVLVLFIAAFGYALVHPLYVSATHFPAELLKIVKQAQHGKGAIGRLVTRFHLEKYVAQHLPALKTTIADLSRPALAVGKTVLSGVVTLVTVAFVSFFLIIEGPGLLREVLNFLPEQRSQVYARVINQMARQVTGFMFGDFATSVIAGLVVFVTLEALGVPFAGVFAIWVAFVDFLPLVGGLLAGVPTVGLAFLHSVFAGIVTLVVFLVYQQIENHLLYPIIISHTLKLNPLFVLLAVLFGAEIGGILGSTFGAICGALIAVPAAGSVQVLARELLFERRSAQNVERALD